MDDALPLPDVRQCATRELLAVIPALEWTIAHQPQRAQEHLARVRAELARREAEASLITTKSTKND